jgi:hypothetical protein
LNKNVYEKQALKGSNESLVKNIKTLIINAKKQLNVTLKVFIVKLTAEAKF